MRGNPIFGGILKNILSKMTAVLFTVGLVTAGSIVSAPAAQAAYPTSCKYWGSGSTAYAVCDSGGGAFAVIAVCIQTPLFGGKKTEFLYGNYATPGNISRADCKANWSLDYAGLTTINT
ncbi:hypothetical protein ACT3TS_08245 [Specibacter sp. AOP5-B1-6]|uniref:hypothetical protein n=1 Tax=Specibacter sp. AOP5-B1-6 TaxID=3457653 RepID=UPI00402B8C11